MKGGLRLGAVAGIVAPGLMVVLWAIAGGLRPGYDQSSQVGSELGMGPNSIIMNANFIATGFLMLVFLTGLIRSMHGGHWLKIGLILIGASAIGEMAGGWFPCDPGCPPTGSVSQMVHPLIAIVFFASIVLSPLSVGLGLGWNSFWTRYATFSIVTGIASVALYLVFAVAVFTSFQYLGLIQRLFLSLPLLWIAIMGRLLFRAESIYEYSQYVLTPRLPF